MSDGICYATAAAATVPANCLPNSVSAAFERRLHLVVEDLLLGDAGQHGRMPRLEEAIQLLLVAAQLFDGHRIEEALRRRVDDRDLLLDRQRLILRLLQNLHQPAAAIELRLCRLVEVAAELRERRELAILREVEPQRAGHLAHRLESAPSRRRATPSCRR